MVGGRNPVADRQNREDRLHRAGGAEQMSDAGFGRGHRHPSGGIADHALHGAEFDLVAKRRRRAVRVDIVDLARGIPARFIAMFMQRKAPSPSGEGAVM